MTCEDAVDFVSALCDGERIPREAAEHIGQCGDCGARLQDYAILGAELRRTASLHDTESAPAVERLVSAMGRDAIQDRQKTRFAAWWKKGGEAMRIPRFAFALLILIIVGLSSGLVVVKARSTAQGSVLLLTLRVAKLGWRWQCYLSTTGGECAGILGLKGNGGLAFGAQVLAQQADHITLGIHSRFSPPSPTNEVAVRVSPDDLKNLPMEQYQLEPGETLHIEIQGLGEAEVTGELLDHMPALWPGEALDPAQDELRLVLPVLLCGRQAIIDVEGSVTGTARDGAVWMYEPGVGRLIVSGQDFPGAVKGKVNESRIDFEINGSQYHLLAGAPITRAEDVWVQLDPAYRPAAGAGGPIGWAELGELLGKQATPARVIGHLPT